MIPGVASTPRHQGTKKGKNSMAGGSSESSGRLFSVLNAWCLCVFVLNLPSESPLQTA